LQAERQKTIGIDYFQAIHPETLFKERNHYVELLSDSEILPIAIITSAPHEPRRRTKFLAAPAQSSGSGQFFDVSSATATCLPDDCSSLISTVAMARQPFASA
jgi:hypothetical protein